MNPQKIDRYEILSELGRGGMAIVYRAYDPQTQREVALKVLPPEYLHNRQFRARFQREIEILTSFKHVGVVSVYGYGQYQGQPYLVMRYMSGGSLEDRIRAKGSLSVSEAAVLLEHLAPALEAAHQQGIIHRDLKPANILFDELDQPHIADFGIARLAEQAGMTQLTGSMMIGTPAYMSPEQANGDKALDGRSDVYALGVMIFQMLTGKLPYEADTPMQMALKHISKPIPNILDSRPDLPAGMKKVMGRVLTKDREKRYQTARAFATALAAVAQAETAGTPAARLARWVRQVPVWVWVLAVSGIFLIGILLGLFAGNRNITPGSTPTLSASATLIPTGTNVPSPTQNAAPSATAVPSVIPTAIPTLEIIPSPISTETSASTGTLPPLSTPTASPTLKPTQPPPPTQTPKPKPTNTLEPLPTITITLEPPATNTPKPTNTNVPADTETNTPVPPS